MEREPSKHWQTIRNALRAGHLREDTLQNYDKAQGLGIELPPPVPQQSIKPNLLAFKNYRDHLHPSNQHYANAIMSHLDKVSFPQLKLYLQQLANRINEHCQSQNYDAIYFFIRGRDKSEYWILQLLFPLLNIEVQGLMEMNSLSNEHLEEEWKIILRATKPCLILVDDGTYSGTQCADHVFTIIDDLINLNKLYPGLLMTPKLEIVFGFAYATTQALMLINNILELINQKQFFDVNVHRFIYQIHSFYIKKVLTHSEIDWGELQKNYPSVILHLLVDNPTYQTTLIYTDWRTPDNVSSIERFFKGVPPIQFCKKEIIPIMELKRKRFIKTEAEEIIPTQLRGPYKKPKAESSSNTSPSMMPLK